MALSPLESRMAHLEGAYEQVNQRLGSIDLRFEGVDRRLETLDRKIDALRVEVTAKIDQRFMWTICIVASGWFTTIAAILPLYFRH